MKKGEPKPIKTRTYMKKGKPKPIKTRTYMKTWNRTALVSGGWWGGGVQSHFRVKPNFCCLVVLGCLVVELWF